MAEKQSAVCMRIHTHTAIAFWRKFSQLRLELSVSVKKFFSLVTPHPVFQDFQMSRLGKEISDWDLVGAKGSFNLLAIHHFWAGPALGTTQDDDGPTRTLSGMLNARLALNLRNLIGHGIHGGGHDLVHDLRIFTFDEVRFVSVANKHVSQF